MAPQVVFKHTYSYKADIWSIGVILFEMLNGQTPFHARNREEFNGKVEACSYNFKDSIQDNLTMECILFLSQCLQHDENDRKCVSELVHHPYITKPFDEQQKLNSKHLGMIFQNPNDLGVSQTKHKRATSAAPTLRGAPMPKLLQFNAKDQGQLNRI